MAQPATESSAKEAKPQDQRTFASQARTEDVTGEKPPNGYWTTMMHFAKGYVGTGIFAMGEGYKNSGLIGGTVLLFLIGFINVNCQRILIRTAEKINQEEGKEVKPSFAETVQYTLNNSKLACLKNNAKTLGWFTNFSVVGCELGFCCVYYVFIADHLLEIASNHNLLNHKQPESIHIVLLIMLIPMWASTFLRNLKLLLPLSIIANILIWSGVIIVFYYTTYEGLPPASDRYLLSPLERWPLYFGTVLYAFEGITFILPLRNEMKRPEQFINWYGVLNVGMVFVMILYFFVGMLSYWKYGEDVESSVFLNLTQEDKNMSDVINVIVSIAILFTFTLHMYIPFEVTFPLIYRKYGPFKHGIVVAALYRSSLVLTTWTLANVVPFLGLFISLIGATGGSFLTLIMPPILEMIAFQGELGIVIIVKDILILILGVVGSAFGTVMAIIAIVNKFRVEYFGEEL
ncbi:hypothetical protein Zmor_012584 [Zophobas morio]|uniref:Amino acid transporter transmembrane domain-containing protein n=1 Tax=Zophobas morio TaxID=2755281 RepID=A0AA38IBQ5_9CUCU|nr:hypothetical protein Zmor_012584 [Zophobas morio]